METHKNAFLVGLFVLIVIIGGLGFTFWLTAAGKGAYAAFRINFSEPVGGLKIGAAITFRGVKVGTLDNLTINPDDTKLVLADVSILKSTPIKEDTKATLKWQGFTGDIYIDLSGGSPDKPYLIASSKDKVPEIESTPSTVNTLVTRLPEILDKMDLLLDKANHIAGQADKVFSNKNVKAVNGVVKNLAQHYGKTDEPKQPEAPAHRK